MPRHPIRPPIILTLALLSLILLAPHAKALPRGHTLHQATEYPQAGPGLFSQLWSFLSTIWSENGSALEPNGAAALPSATNSGYGTDNPQTSLAPSGPDTAPGAVPGDTGPGLDPDG